MTEFEIYKWLWKEKADLFLVQNCLDKLVFEKKIATKDGLYFFTGREESVNLRKEKYTTAEKKYKKAIKVVKILQLVPFIKFIGICNTLLILDFKEKSDIDFFIIVKKGRLWLTRFLVTFTTAISGNWRHGRKVKDRICLSFYITNDSLSLQKIALKDEDPYLVYWLSFLVPILDRGEYHKFLRANAWVKEFLPQFMPYGSILKRRRIIESRLLSFFRLNTEKILANKLGDWVEQLFSSMQKKKMEKKEKARKEKNSGVIISDQMLKFHEVDRKKIYKERWQDNYRQVSIKS